MGKAVRNVGSGSLVAYEPEAGRTGFGAQPVAIGLEDLLAALGRRWGVLLGVALLAGGLVLAWGLGLPPSYKAQGAVLVRSVPLTAADAGTTYRDLMGKEVTVATEQDFIASDAFLLGIAQQIQPTPEEMRPAWAPKPLIDFVAGLSGSSGTPAPPTLSDKVEWLRGGLSVTANDQSNIINIAFTSPSAVRSAQVVNKIFDDYIEIRSEQRRELIGRLVTGLSGRINGVESEAASADARSISMLQDPGVLRGYGNEPVVDDLARLKETLRQAQADTAMRQTQYQAAVAARRNAGEDLGRLTTAWDSPLLNQLRERLATIEQEQARMAATRGPRHPESVALAQQRAQVETNIRAETDRIVSGLEAQYSAAQRYEQQLQQNLDQSGSQLQSVRGDAVAIQELRARVQTLRNAADGMRQEREQILSRGDVPIATVVAPAVPPLRDTAPSPIILGGVAAVFAAGLASVAIITRTQLQAAGSTGGVAPYRAAVDRPVLGVVPNFRRFGRKQLPSPSKMLTSDSWDPLTESVRDLVVKLELQVVSRGPAIILVTSARPGEGKSTTTAFLGVQFARCGHRTLLIDADLRHPSLAALLPSGAGGAWEDLVIDEHQYGIWTSGSASLSTLTLSGAGEPPHILFRSQHFAELLSWARKNYDVVLLDTPPVLSVSDAVLLTRFADSVVLATEAREMDFEDLSEAANRLLAANASLTGVVVTKFRASQGDYYSGY